MTTARQCDECRDVPVVVATALRCLLIFMSHGTPRDKGTCRRTFASVCTSLIHRAQKHGHHEAECMTEIAELVENGDFSNERVTDSLESKLGLLKALSEVNFH